MVLRIVLKGLIRGFQGCADALLLSESGSLLLPFLAEVPESSPQEARAMVAVPYIRILRTSSWSGSTLLLRGDVMPLPTLMSMSSLCRNSVSCTRRCQSVRLAEAAGLI